MDNGQHLRRASSVVATPAQAERTARTVTLSFDKTVQVKTFGLDGGLVLDWTDRSDYAVLCRDDWPGVSVWWQLPDGREGHEIGTQPIEIAIRSGQIHFTVTADEPATV